MEGFFAHFYSKRGCIAQNMHQQNAKLSGVNFHVTVNIYARFFTFRDCPYKGC